MSTRALILKISHYWNLLCSTQLPRILISNSYVLFSSMQQQYKCTIYLYFSYTQINKTGYVIIVEQVFSDKKALFSMGNSTWLLRWNDSFHCICCLQRTGACLITVSGIFFDTVTMGSIPVCMLFNYWALGRTQFKTLFARITLFNHTSRCSTIIT